MKSHATCSWGLGFVWINKFSVESHLAALLILLEILKINSFEAREGSLKGKIKIPVYYVYISSTSRVLRVLDVLFHSTPSRVTLKGII